MIEAIKQLLKNKEDLPLLVTSLSIENNYLKQRVKDLQEEIERLIKMSE